MKKNISRIIFSFFFLTTTTTHVWAGSIDEAEAKRRGISVEAVELEEETAKNIDLQKKITQLQVDNTSLKKQLTDITAKLADITSKYETVKKVMTPEEQAKLDMQTTILKAINEHKLVNGMTVEQASKSISVKFLKTSESSDGEIWEGAISKQNPLRDVGGITVGGDTNGTTYTLYIKDGIVEKWESNPFHIEPGTARVINR